MARQQQGRVLKKLNARQSENVLVFFEIPTSNRLKVFCLHLQSLSDQKTGVASQLSGCGFLGIE